MRQQDIPKQAGFRPGRNELQQSTVTNFIDFTGAFDSIKAFYQRASVQLCVYGELPGPFELRNSFRQGYVLCPTIFNCVLMRNPSGSLCPFCFLLAVAFPMATSLHHNGHRFSTLKRCTNQFRE